MFGQVLDGFRTGFRQVLNTNVDHVSQIFPENDHGRDGRYGRFLPPILTD